MSALPQSSQVRCFLYLHWPVNSIRKQILLFGFYFQSLAQCLVNTVIHWAFGEWLPAHVCQLSGGGGGGDLTSVNRKVDKYLLLFMLLLESVSSISHKHYSFVIFMTFSILLGFSHGFVSPYTLLKSVYIYIPLIQWTNKRMVIGQTIL